jgi:hypothetical protein
LLGLYSAMKTQFFFNFNTEEYHTLQDALQCQNWDSCALL